VTIGISSIALPSVAKVSANDPNQSGGECRDGAGSPNDHHPIDENQTSVLVFHLAVTHASPTFIASFFAAPSSPLRLKDKVTSSQVGQMMMGTSVCS